MKPPRAMIDRLIYTVVMPFLFPLVFLNGLAWVRHVPSEWRLLRSMKRRGRYMTVAAALDAFAAGRGTVIWELANPRISRLWWIDDAIRQRPLDRDEFGPLPPAPDPAFDQWVYEHYLAPKTGKALLVRTGKVSVISPGGTFSSPGDEMVFVYTGRVQKRIGTSRVT